MSLAGRLKHYRQWWDDGQKPLKSGYLCLLLDLEESQAHVRELEQEVQLLRTENDQPPIATTTAPCN